MESLLTKVRQGLSSLQGSPRELYKAYILKFLDSYSYFSFSIIFTLFLSDDFGYSDVAAGSLYGGWGALITVYGMLTGWIVDNLGVATSLRLGFCLSLISRCLIFATTSRIVLLCNVFGLLPLANCLGIPVLTTGIRRYTNESNRGFAFGLFYVVMNVAALLSGPVVDSLTIWYKETENADVGVWSLTSYRAIILTGIVSNLLACVVAFTVREIKVDSGENRASNENGTCADDADETCGDDADDPRLQYASDRVSQFIVSPGSPLQILKETVRAKSFWRFLVVCLLTLNVKMIFRHLDATLPKYMLREFGDDVPKGTIYSINPALIILLVPLVTAATTTVNPLIMIHHGSYISAASVFCLVLSTSIPACVAFVVLLSIGEAIWSPRLYDYTMSVVQEGREGTYMALSSAPLFLAKLPVGFMSGYLLQNYCPEEGERHSKMMWLIIGLTTAVSPVLLTVFWKYVSSKDEDSKYTELRDIRSSQITEEDLEMDVGQCPMPSPALT